MYQQPKKENAYNHMHWWKKSILQNLTPVLFNVTRKVLATEVGQEIEICTGKEETQPSLFGDNTCVCMENPEEPTK